MNDKIKDPFLSGNVPKIYVGGVFREDVESYDKRIDLIDSMFYKGQADRSPYWRYKRRYTPNNVLELEETKQNRSVGILED